MLQRTKATVSMGFVSGMLAGMQRRGQDYRPLLQESGIDLAEPASRVPIAAYATLYNRATRQLHDEGFALFSQPMPPGSFEFLCRGVLSAPTLAEALHRASRFLKLVLPDMAVSVRRQQGRAELVSPRPAAWPSSRTIPAASSPSSGCCACCTGWPAGSPGAASA